MTWPIAFIIVAIVICAAVLIWKWMDERYWG